MRYISNEKEMRRLSIYTNIKSVEDILEKKSFYKIDSKQDNNDERILVAIIDSSEPFFTRNVMDSEVIFDITGGYPNSKKRVYKGISKLSLLKVDLWLEIIMSAFSVEVSADKLDLPNYLEELENYKKIDVKKYILTEEIIRDLDDYDLGPKSKKNENRLLYIIINGHVIFPSREKDVLTKGMEWKYGLKTFQKTCQYMFDKKDETLGYVYELKKEM